MNKYEGLRTHNTNGANYGISVEDIIARLKDWDGKYGIDVSDVGFDKVTVHFQSLPDDPASLATEIYGFCPDTVDQNFACDDEIVDFMHEMGEEVPDHMRELVKGVDFEDDHYGLELLKRSLAKNRMIVLWWD